VLQVQYNRVYWGARRGNLVTHNARKQFGWGAYSAPSLSKSRTLFTSLIRSVCKMPITSLTTMSLSTDHYRSLDQILLTWRNQYGNRCFCHVSWHVGHCIPFQHIKRQSDLFSGPYIRWTHLARCSLLLTYWDAYCDIVLVCATPSAMSKILLLCDAFATEYDIQLMHRSRSYCCIIT